jgi:hypothetical protein
VEVKYRGPERFDIPLIQRNFEAAIASDPSAMALTIADADALVPMGPNFVTKEAAQVVIDLSKEGIR